MPSAESQVEQLRIALAKRDGELAKRDAELAERESEIQKLRAEVARLANLLATQQERLGQNSSNSSKPPSSDCPSDKPKKKPGKGKRKRGGQQGHKGHHRTRLPESQVDVIDFYPEECMDCGAALPKTSDPNANWHQVTEVPPVKPHTTEYRSHEVFCSCGCRTRAPWGANMPQGQFGPRLSSITAMLTGAYHLSRRRVQKLLSDLLGVSISVGGISNVEARVSAALEPAVDEAWVAVNDAKAKNTDGTSWKTCNIPMQLWTIATTAATVFKIVVDGSKETLKPLYGELKGILTSDRAKALNFWAMERRQICWSHLIRKFVSFSERDGPAGPFGRRLLEYTGIFFSYWHDYQDKRISRKVFLHRMAPVRRQVEALLEEVVAANIKGVSGSCADILLYRVALWTFADRLDVEPTNNHAERELRAFVLWRKRSFGTQSARGNVFAENMMTVVHTARKQQRDVLPLLTDYCRAAWAGTPAPTLITAK